MKQKKVNTSVDTVVAEDPRLVDKQLLMHNAILYADVVDDINNALVYDPNNKDDIDYMAKRSKKELQKYNCKNVVLSSNEFASTLYKGKSIKTYLYNTCCKEYTYRFMHLYIYKSSRAKSLMSMIRKESDQMNQLIYSLYYRKSILYKYGTQKSKLIDEVHIMNDISTVARRILRRFNRIREFGFKYHGWEILNYGDYLKVAKPLSLICLVCDHYLNIHSEYLYIDRDMLSRELYKNYFNDIVLKNGTQTIEDYLKD